jgi:hypothetical protein
MRCGLSIDSIVMAMVLLTLFVGLAEAARPMNGTLIKSGELNGFGEINIQNNLQEDAVAILADLDNNTVLSAYVWGNRNFVNISGIEDGQYFLYFATGRDWDPEIGEFATDAGFSMMNKPIEFKTKETWEGVTFGIMNVQINSTWRSSIDDSDNAKAFKKGFPKAI